MPIPNERILVIMVRIIVNHKPLTSRFMVAGISQSDIQPYSFLSLVFD
jgi:hypothetical protein